MFCYVTLRHLLRHLRFSTNLIIPFFAIFDHLFDTEKARKNAEFIAFLGHFIVIMTGVKNNCFSSLLLPHEEPFSVQFQAPAVTIPPAEKIFLLLPPVSLAIGISYLPITF